MNYLDVLWAYLLVSAPYLLLGLLVSGIIYSYIPMEKVKKWLGTKNKTSVLRAALVGVPLPLCSCSVIPTAVTLRKAGASNGATSAFLISTPESGVDSISMTYALMDLPMTIIRPIAAFSSAMVAGLFQEKLNDFEVAKDIAEPPHNHSHNSATSIKAIDNKLIKSFKYGFGKLSNDIAGWLTIGILLGALIDFLVPENFFSGQSIILSRIMILLVGIPLYICASASTPIAVSLMLKGLSPGSALLFLLVGPATNISNIAVLQKFIGKKGVVINILSIAGVALLFSFLTDFLYMHFFKLQLSENLISHNHSGAWWEIASALILIALLGKGIFIENIRPKFSKKKKSCH